MLFMFNILMRSWKQCTYCLEIKDEKTNKQKTKNDMMKKLNRSDNERSFMRVCMVDSRHVLCLTKTLALAFSLTLEETSVKLFMLQIYRFISRFDDLDLVSRSIGNINSEVYSCVCVSACVSEWVRACVWVCAYKHAPHKRPCICVCAVVWVRVSVCMQEQADRQRHTETEELQFLHLSCQCSWT